MTGFVMFLHAIVAIFLIVIILMQSGRGGGLTEGFASAESIFGAKTNEFMIKATTVFATVFLITCLSLALLSVQKSRSLMVEEATPVAPLPGGLDTVDDIVKDAAQETDEQVKTMEEKVAPKTTAEVPSDFIPENAPVTDTP